MTRVLEKMVSDIAEQGGGLPGYLLERTCDILTDAQKRTGDAALDDAAAGMEALYERVLHYRDSLIGMEVPHQEHERHDSLLEAFTAYSEVLIDLFDALTGEDDLYHPRLLQTLARADRCLYRHRSAALKGPGLAVTA